MPLLLLTQPVGERNTIDNAYYIDHKRGGEQGHALVDTFWRSVYSVELFIPLPSASGSQSVLIIIHQSITSRVRVSLVPKAGRIEGNK